MATTSAPPRRRSGTIALIVVVWALNILPISYQALAGTKRQTRVGEEAPLVTGAAYAEVAIKLCLCLVVAIVISNGIRQLPRSGGCGVLIFLAPWTYIIVRDLAAGHPPGFNAVTYPLLVIAFWLSRPQIGHLSILGWLVGLTAIGSMALAVLSPQQGFYNDQAGNLLIADKAILSGPLLAGVYVSANNLGLYLSIGAPATLLVRHAHARIALYGAVGFALLWTGSRSAIAAYTVGAIVLLALRTNHGAIPGHVRINLLGAALATFGIAGALIAALNSDPSAFSLRGSLWERSLDAWSGDWLFGLGSRWYQVVGQYRNTFGDAQGGVAFHGHNQFVQMLVSGGLVLATLCIVMYWRTGIAVMRCAKAKSAVPAAIFASMLISGALEYPLGYVDRQQFWSVTLVPCLVAVFSSSIPKASRGRLHKQDDMQTADARIRSSHVPECRSGRSHSPS